MQFCEVPSCSSSQQPRVGYLHDTPRLLSLFYLLLSPPLFLYLTTAIITCSGKRSAPAFCSTITPPNPPPSVCISAVLIAPETQSNGPGMCAGVQLTGPPLSFSFPLYPGYPFHIYHLTSFSSPMWSPLLTLTLLSISSLPAHPPLQLQNQSELRAPTAEKAAFFLDAAIAARSTSRPNADEEERRNSHMLFTLHIYQYRMEKSGKGGS